MAEAYIRARGVTKTYRSGSSDLVVFEDLNLDVERAVDILSVERSGTYRGKFHVLGGNISPLDGIEPEDLRIAELEKRLTHESSVKEIVIALGTDVEGDATSYYLAKRLARKGLKISRIAYGLPAGSGLEFADELTLSRALEGRREMN